MGGGAHAFLRDFTICGTADEVRSKVETYAGQGVTELVYQPWMTWSASCAHLPALSVYSVSPCPSHSLLRQGRSHSPARYRYSIGRPCLCHQRKAPPTRTCEREPDRGRQGREGDLCRKLHLSSP